MYRLGILSLLLIGCKAVDPAPEDFDALMHYFWNQAEDGSDAQPGRGGAEPDVAIDSGTLDEATDGSLTPLSFEEAAVANHTRDPSHASGVFLLNPFDCAVDTTELILHLDQQSVYPGVYDMVNEPIPTQEMRFWPTNPPVGLEIGLWCDRFGHRIHRNHALHLSAHRNGHARGTLATR